MNPSKRTALVVLGLAFAALAVLDFIPQAINNITAISYYMGAPSSLIQPLPNIVFMVFDFLMLAVLAISGILLLAESFRMKRAGQERFWCAMLGIADLLLAAACAVALVSDIYYANYQLMIELMDMNYDFVIALGNIINVPYWLLSVAAGFLYVVGGFSQKKASKTNILFAIAGIALALAAILQCIFTFGTGFIINTFDPSMLNVGFLVFAVIVLVGRVLRGFAPFALPKTPQSPSYQQQPPLQQPLQQPVQQQPLQQQPLQQQPLQQQPPAPQQAPQQQAAAPQQAPQQQPTEPQQPSQQQPPSY